MFQIPQPEYLLPFFKRYPLITHSRPLFSLPLSNHVALEIARCLIIYDADAHMNAQFTDRDWLEKNKLQTITMDIQCQTWAMAEDKNHRYCVTRKVLFDFLEGSGYLPNLVHGEGNIDDAAQKIVWDIFMGQNESGKIDPIIPKDMRREIHNFTVPPGMPINNPVQGELDFGH
jgi:hypothetical protein